MFFSMVLYSVLYYNKFYRGNGYRLIVTIEWLLLNIIFRKLSYLAV